MKMRSDPFFRIIETEIVIPGLTAEYKLMQFSDVHLAVWDELSTPEEREKAESSEACWLKLREDFTVWNSEPFDEHKRIPSREVLEKMFALAEETKPDALLLSGDIADYPAPAMTRLLRRKLAEYGGRSIFVQGNHDYGRDVLSCDGVQVLDLGEVLVVGIDDNALTVSDIALAELKSLCTLGRPIIMLQHVPVMTERNREKIDGFGEYFRIDERTEDENAAQFVRLERDEPTVKAVLCGHTHAYNVSEIAEGKKQYCSSSALAGFVNMITVKG